MLKIKHDETYPIVNIDVVGGPLVLSFLSKANVDGQSGEIIGVKCAHSYHCQDSRRRNLRLVILNHRRDALSPRLITNVKVFECLEGLYH